MKVYAICPNCGKEITKRRKKFCSNNKCIKEYNQKQLKLTHPDKECLHCNKSIPYNKKFCNRSCSVSFNNTGKHHSDETKLKLREKAILNNSAKNFKNLDGSVKLNSVNQKKSKRIIKTCKCGKEFETPLDTQEKKFCSNDCWKKHSGGLRHGTSRGKKGWYKGYYCDSTYELAFVIYNIDHNIKFKRSKIVIPYEYKNKKHNYHPDFEIDDTIIEIKGYHNEQVDAKIAATLALGYNFKILYKTQLEHMFEHIKNSYKYTKIEELYE